MGPKEFLAWFQRVISSVDAPDTECCRKRVGSAVFMLGFDWQFICRSSNGPIPGHECLNIVGGCGCQHAEPRAILKTAGQVHPDTLLERKVVLYSEYSPCTNCAKMIVDCEFIDCVVYNHHTDHDPVGLDIIRSAGLKVFTMHELSALSRLTGTETGPEIADLVEEFNVFFGPWPDSRIDG